MGRAVADGVLRRLLSVLTGGGLVPCLKAQSGWEVVEVCLIGAVFAPVGDSQCLNGNGMLPRRLGVSAYTMPPRPGEDDCQAPTRPG